MEMTAPPSRKVPLPRRARVRQWGIVMLCVLVAALAFAAKHAQYGSDGHGTYLKQSVKMQNRQTPGQSQVDVVLVPAVVSAPVAPTAYGRCLASYRPVAFVLRSVSASRPLLI